MTAIPVENTRLVEELPDVITSTPGLTADDMVILSKSTTDPNAGDYKLTLFDLIIWLYNDAALTGYATAPTQITEVNDDSIATTAFVQNRLAEVTNNYLGTDSIVDALTSTDSTVPLSANQGYVIWQWLTAIEDVLGSKLPISDYNDYYKGLFASEAALNAALPDIGISGNYAIVDQGPGNPAKLYVWDGDLPAGQHWVPGGDITPSSTDSLAEGAIKLYFTTQRAIDAGATAFIRYDLAQTLTTLQKQTALANLGISNTDGLNEGTTNLYFTTARAIAAVSSAFLRFDQSQALTTQQKNNVLTSLGIAGLQSFNRATVNLSTGTLTAGQTVTGTIQLGKSYRLLKFSSDHQCRLRLYDIEEHRDADISRAIGIDPTGDHGLMFEFVAVTGLLTATLAPLVDGFDGKATPDGLIPYTMTMSDTGPAAVNIALTFLPTE